MYYCYLHMHTSYSTPAWCLGGSYVGHIIKPGMETGNEMERNEINLQCSGGYSLRNIL